MDHIIASLGLSLPPLSAKDAVTRPPMRTRHRLSRYQYPPRVIVLQQKVSSTSSLSDDDTASTASFDESFDFSDSSSQSVRFMAEPVTHVFERPLTSLAEKHELYYSDLEYRQFRREFFRFRKNQVYAKESTATIRFAEELVSAVHEYEPCESPDSELYYSEDDVQRFLDEFMKSLTVSNQHKR